MQTLVTILVFAPMIAAIIAGLFGRRIGNAPRSRSPPAR
jgi:NADH-quinone oxidoreductase subunit L